MEKREDILDKNSFYGKILYMPLLKALQRHDLGPVAQSNLIAKVTVVLFEHVLCSDVSYRRLTTGVVQRSDWKRRPFGAVSNQISALRQS